jgi:hypothetical protein
MLEDVIPSPGRFPVNSGLWDLSRCARKRHMHRSKTALLFDHVVCALLEKSSLPCSLDCAE